MLPKLLNFGQGRNVRMLGQTVWKEIISMTTMIKGCFYPLLNLMEFSHCFPSFHCLDFVTKI